jgi:hypothetical protein
MTLWDARIYVMGRAPQVDTAWQDRLRVLRPTSLSAPAGVTRITFGEPGSLGMGFNDIGDQILVSQINPGSQAAQHAELQVGSVLVRLEYGSVNDSVEGMPYEEVLNRLRLGVRPLAMSFRSPSAEPANVPMLPALAAVAPIPALAPTPVSTLAAPLQTVVQQLLPAEMHMPPTARATKTERVLPSYAGFLSKLSPNRNGGWQERWFVLEAGKLSYYKEKDARTMFQEVDTDNSGHLDMEEVFNLCTLMGKKKLTKKEVQSAMDEMDRDGNNQVDFEEFEAWWGAHGGKAASKRAAAGVINLLGDDMRGISSVGTGQQIAINLADRSYQLQAKTVELATIWIEKFRQTAPSEEALAAEEEAAEHQSQVRRVIASTYWITAFVQ